MSDVITLLIVADTVALLIILLSTLAAIHRQRRIIERTHLLIEHSLQNAKLQAEICDRLRTILQQ